MADVLVIPARFRGPPDSGNGGYTCGLVAAAAGLPAGPAAVSLRSPPPLGTELAVEREGDFVRALDGDTLVAEGRPAQVDLEPPAAIGYEEARAASERGFELWSGAHPFPTCFVCGPDRTPGDGLRIFPGELGDSGTFAAVWTPPAGTDVEDEVVWAALDCPTSAPVANYGGPPVVLGELAAQLDRPVRAGEPHVLLSWKLAAEGRKRRSAAALFDSRGRVLARSRALWIELRTSSDV